MGVTGWPRNVAWSEFDPRSSRPAGETEDAQIAPIADAPTSGIKIGRDGNKLKLGPFTIKVYVDGSQSWVVTAAKSASLLSHEQGHYDIAGLGAWEEHRRFEALRADNPSKLADMIQEVLQTSKQKTQDLQDYYDSTKQTNNGRNPTKQAEWEKKIADAIKNNYQALPDAPPRAQWNK